MKKRYEFIKEGFRYFMRKNPNGYGSEIIKTPKDRYKFISLFRSLDSKLVIYQFEALEQWFIDGNETDFKFIDTSGEEDMMKVLRIEAKHYTYHFSVPTHNLFHKAFRKFLTTEYGKCVDNFKPQEPVNDTGLTCHEDINKIPFDDVRIDLSNKWTEYENMSKKYKDDMLGWENLKAVVTTEDKGIAIDAIEYLRGHDTWELINLDIVE